MYPPVNIVYKLPEYFTNILTTRESKRIREREILSYRTNKRKGSSFTFVRKEPDEHFSVAFNPPRRIVLLTTTLFVVSVDIFYRKREIKIYRVKKRGRIFEEIERTRVVLLAVEALWVI